MSKRVKVGDILVRITASNGYFTEGKEYRVSGTLGSTIYITADDGTDEEYNYPLRYFKLKEESSDMKKKKKGKGKEKKEDKSQEYTFTVSSDKLINTNEIAMNLTRENPLAIVLTDDGRMETFIHYSIWQKALVVKKSIANMLYDANDAMVGKLEPLDSGKLSALTAAVKAVRNAKVKGKRKPVTLTVKLLDI